MFSFQHRLLDELNLRFQIVPPVDRVAGIRIDHQLKLLVRLLQSIRKLHRVLKVHVVVDQAVDDEQLAVEVFAALMQELSS